MPNKMLIDSTHPEETRVVVLRGNRVEEFDFESANRKQLRGNIYLAKVTRVEPSLQAAFVDYGGNRHGFLAFSEIHPDYYQIPVADRQALIDEEERAQRAADAEADNRATRAPRQRPARRPREQVRSEAVPQPIEDGAMAAGCERMMPPSGEPEESQSASEASLSEDAAGEDSGADTSDVEPGHDEPARADAQVAPHTEMLPKDAQPAIELSQLQSSVAIEGISLQPEEPRTQTDVRHEAADAAGSIRRPPVEPADPVEPGTNVTEVNGNGSGGEDEEVIESVGGADAMEEVPERMPRLRRQYKIQEVIKRRQVMLVQVVKEERGTKGAALTTYLSLAGRYSVLMPNTARGGGISRKITDAQDRRRLKELVGELEVPDGMGVILRTAGATRTKTEIKRDFEYLLRLWETVRDLTLKSTAPTLVYEEGSLVKRSIRDLYNKDIDEILVAGESGFKDAKEFMRMLMPSHAKNVKPFRDSLPMFTRFGIESQLDAMFQPVVQLRSGGYIVLNQAEALVAIDVNSGRATREHHIEDTALKTNIEAAEEIARQLRLRDLAGLIVIDFIDMDEKRNNRTVERRLKDALKQDRARIQVGHISHFGLLEMSRQRIRSSVLESSTDKCPHCGGTGHLRSVSSVALQLLRALEEMLLKSGTHDLIVRTRTEIALYLLNQKRAHLRALEERFRLTITVHADATMGGQQSYALERGDLVHSPEQARAIAAQPMSGASAIDEEEIEDEVESEAEETAAEASNEDQRGEEEQDDGRRRRRRRRGRRNGDGRDGPFVPLTGTDHATGPSADHAASEPMALEAGQGHDLIADAAPDAETAEAVESESAETNGQDGSAQASDIAAENERRRRRRGRRGGRRNRRGREGEELPESTDVAAFEAEPEGREGEAVPHVEPAGAWDVPPRQHPDGSHGGEHLAANDARSETDPRTATWAGDRPEPARGRRPGRGRHHDASASPPDASASPPWEPRLEPQAEAPHHIQTSPDRSAPDPASSDHFRAAVPPSAAEAVPAAEPSNPAEPVTEPARRRRSTVREPAPVSFASEAVPAPVPLPPLEPLQPVVTSSEDEEAPRPRRSGWWSKRVLGKG